MRINGINFFQQTRKCGKEHCHCATGAEHGPYWYATAGGHTRYVGKELPADVEVAMQVLKQNEPILALKLEQMDQEYRDLRRAKLLVRAFLRGDHLFESDIRDLEAATGLNLRLV
jgi:hypothetical protein